jgi:hypothetical protein
MLKPITFRGSRVAESHGRICQNEVVELRELQQRSVVGSDDGAETFDGPPKRTS